MLKKILLCSSLLVFSGSVFSASSRHLVIDQNCSRWANIASATIDGKNLGKTKQEILADIEKTLTGNGVAPETILVVQNKMSGIFDTTPLGTDETKVFDDMYKECIITSIKP